MKKLLFIELTIFIVITICTTVVSPFLTYSNAKGVKTSYKRYSIFQYKNEEILCEPYIVNKDDWLYKIFRKKGEIAEKDFPSFIIIFKEINPQISNIDAIEPDNNILIPLKKVKKGDFDQSTPGSVEIPVIEFATISKDLNIKTFTREHEIKKGDSVSRLIDKNFLKKNGALSEEGLKAFQLANPHIKNIDVIYEGAKVYLPDPSIKSQPWFNALLSGKEKETQPKIKTLDTEPYKIQAQRLAQLKKYSSLIGGTLINRGKMYFPGKNDSSLVLDLSSTPIIKADDGSRILIVSGDNVNEELLEYVKTYWQDLKTQLISETIEKVKNYKKTIPKRNVTAEYKKIVKKLLFHTDYDYIPDAKIPFTIKNMILEASFGRIIIKNKPDLLINFGNVYGSALEVLRKQDFEIISITPKLAPLGLADKLFSALGYTTWENPSFPTGKSIESMNGLYIAKKKKKLFIPLKPLSLNAINYLKKENIKILSITTKTKSQ